MLTKSNLESKNQMNMARTVVQWLAKQAGAGLLFLGLKSAPITKILLHYKSDLQHFTLAFKSSILFKEM